MYSKNQIKKIVITGGAGYIGNTLIASLPEEIEIVVIDNFLIDTDYKQLVNEKLTKERKLTLVKSNVSEVDKYKEYLKDADVVLYMASLNSYKESNSDPLLYLRENGTNVRAFLNALKEYSPSVKKIIVTSSRGVYGEGPYLCKECNSRIYPTLSEDLRCTECNSREVEAQPINEKDMTNPSSYYGLTKKLQEDIIKIYCEDKKILFDVFRIFNVFGEDQGKYYSNIGIIPQIHAQILNTGEMYLSGNGDLARDFVYVGDVVNALSASIFGENARESGMEIYNLGSGEAMRIKDIADFFENLGHKFKRNSSSIYGDIKYSVADNSKVKSVFNLPKFTSIYTFLAKVYKKVEGEPAAQYLES